ncbi:hypothetical protein [Azospirillum thiophilum]|uniref:hypothetical protein n=1 Tax=Azospirillum thiophilum TaxID=528244 RepID=UPI000AC693B9|nr:hypothetical protein [Azospirillum thiophilum]
MGDVRLTNLTSIQFIVKKLKINDTEVINSDMGIGLIHTNIFDYSESESDKFKRLIIEVSVKNRIYKIDLNRDHYFGGGAHHYPGLESKVGYIFSGLSVDEKKIQLNLNYAPKYSYPLTYCDDLKYMDLK